MPQVENTLLWIVCKQWKQTGKVEEDSAWFNEDKARAKAAEIVGKGDCWISLRNIRVSDHQSVYADKR